MLLFVALTFTKKNADLTRVTFVITYNKQR